MLIYGHLSPIGKNPETRVSFFGRKNTFVQFSAHLVIRRLRTLLVREFVGALKFREKDQLSNEPTVVYLQQIQESQFELFITKK